MRRNFQDLFICFWNNCEWFWKKKIFFSDFGFFFLWIFFCLFLGYCDLLCNEELTGGQNLSWIYIHICINISWKKITWEIKWKYCKYIYIKYLRDAANVPSQRDVAQQRFNKFASLFNIFMLTINLQRYKYKYICIFLFKYELCVISLWRHQWVNDKWQVMFPKKEINQTNIIK